MVINDTMTSYQSVVIGKSMADNIFNGKGFSPIESLATTPAVAVMHTQLQLPQNSVNTGSVVKMQCCEPQTLQQAVVELVEAEEKKVLSDCLDFSTSSENNEHHQHKDQHHHHQNNNKNNDYSHHISSHCNQQYQSSSPTEAPNSQSVGKSSRRSLPGERPFHCEMCGKTFSRNDHLVRHLSSHHGEKLFKCDICGKALSRRDHLKVHKRIHSGERPYKCSICGFAFSRLDHLVKHNQPNKGRRKLSCVPQVSQMKIEPETKSELAVPVNTDVVPVVAADAEILQQSASSQVGLNQHLPQHTTTTTSDDIITSHNNNNNTNSTRQQEQQHQLYSAISTTTAGAQTLQMYSMAQIFPTTIQMSPSAAQIFPTTIPMNAATAQMFPTLQMYHPISTPVNIAPTSVYTTKQLAEVMTSVPCVDTAAPQ
ncbi:B lymphocyte-induced maturation protein 1 homolog [Argonauta hians]